MTFCVVFARGQQLDEPDSLQTAAFFESNVRVDFPRVRFRSGAKQTHKPTAHTKKTCKCRPS
jgi:hypothetical protein